MEKIIGYTFKNKQLLVKALTHSSYANERCSSSTASNERLEFLGDSVLGMITAAHLYKKYPKVREGELTKKRAALVCEGALCECAKSIGLGEHLLVGKGEEASGGRTRPSILSDAFEALIGAIYLDGGEEPARAFITKFVLKASDSNTDYKTLLQEIVQKNHEETVSYRLKAASGPEHEKVFHVEVLINTNVVCQGQGMSKKHAEQDAAHQVLKLMGIDI